MQFLDISNDCSNIQSFKKLINHGLLYEVKRSELFESYLFEYSEEVDKILCRLNNFTLGGNVHDNKYFVINKDIINVYYAGSYEIKLNLLQQHYRQCRPQYKGQRWAKSQMKNYLLVTGFAFMFNVLSFEEIWKYLSENNPYLIEFCDEFEKSDQRWCEIVNILYYSDHDITKYNIKISLVINLRKRFLFTSLLSLRIQEVAQKQSNQFDEEIESNMTE